MGENHLLGAGQSHQVEVLAPVDGGIALLQHIDGEDIVLLGVVAGFSTAHRGLGKLILDVIHGLGGLLGIAFLVTGEHVHLHEVVDIGLLNLLSVGIGVQVVVTVGQAARAGFHVEHIHVAVHQVSLHGNAEKWVGEVQVLISDKRGEVGLLEGLHICKILHQGSSALTVQAHAVHGQVEQVGHLLAHSAACMLLVCQVVEEFLELFAVLLGQVVEDAIAGILGFEGVGFHPATASILEKVFTGRNGEVHVGTVHTCRDSLCRGSQCAH